MPETGQPTTVERRPPGAEGLHLNLLYFKTLPGIMKIVEFCLGLISCVILGYPVRHGYVYFMVTAYISIAFTVILIFIYALSAREALPNFLWVRIEYIITMINTLLLLSGSAWLFTLDSLYYHNSFHFYAVAASFGVINTLLFHVDAYMLFIGYRR